MAHPHIRGRHDRRGWANDLNNEESPPTEVRCPGCGLDAPRDTFPMSIRGADWWCRTCMKDKVLLAKGEGHPPKTLLEGRCLQLKKIDEFSAPLKSGFEEFADGAIYRALAGEDYENQRSFLGAMTRWAGLNGFEAERVVADGSIEFRFVAKGGAQEKDLAEGSF